MVRFGPAGSGTVGFGGVRYGVIGYDKVGQGIMANKIKTSFTLTQNVIKLIKLLANKYGISQTAVVEIAVRKFAEQENVSLDD